RVFRRLERYLHMRLRRKIVDLIRLRFLHNADDVSRVGHIAVMQMEGNTLLVRIMNQMVDALGIEGRRTALDAMDDVSLGQKKFGEVGAVLSGHAGDEGHLARCSSHYCTTRANAVRSTPAIACVELRGTRGDSGQRLGTGDISCPSSTARNRTATGREWKQEPGKRSRQ